MIGSNLRSFAPPGLFRAEFIERPNRFLVRARAGTLGPLEAHLPNPGRLPGLLFPGTTLLLAPVADAAHPASCPGPDLRSAGRSRRTPYVVWAAERDGRPVLVHTAANNSIARFLLEQGRIPGLENSAIVKAETVHGRSRFDFLMEKDGCRFLLEVKSVTQFANGTAMFPDAVTARARRHLLELAASASASWKPGSPLPTVLFLVHSDQVSRFLPDYHTDLEFSRTFCEVRGRIRITPVSLQWDEDLNLGPQVRLLEIPWTLVEQECRDRGAYLLLIRLDSRRSISVGQLGTLDFERGWYIYVGSAMQHLTTRITRHLRQRKRPHWHIDFLRPEASRVTALPIRSSRREECALAAAFAGILEPGPGGFGASDCSCSRHLFYSERDPCQSEAFHRILCRFRTPPP